MMYIFKRRKKKPSKKDDAELAKMMLDATSKLNEMEHNRKSRIMQTQKSRIADLENHIKDPIQLLNNLLIGHSITGIDNIAQARNIVRNLEAALKETP